MEPDVKDLLDLIFKLLPGFLAAWLFYGLTSHSKPSTFEHTVTAMIFTAVAQTLTGLVRWVLEQLAQFVMLGAWTGEVERGWSLVIAALLGIVLSAAANNDVPHRWLRWLKVTPKTSYPSEWYRAFHRNKSYVVLHLQGGRRLYGWPDEWPDSPDQGQFVMRLASWTLNDGSMVDASTDSTYVIPSSQIEMVEFVELAPSRTEGPEPAKPATKAGEESKDGRKRTPVAAWDVSTD